MWQAVEELERGIKEFDEKLNEVIQGVWECGQEVHTEGKEGKLATTDTVLGL